MLKMSMFGIILLGCFLSPPLLYAQDSQDAPIWYRSIFFSASPLLNFSPESHFGSVRPGFEFRGAAGYEWKGKWLRPSVALSSGWSRFSETDRLVGSVSFVPVTGRAGFLLPFKDAWGVQADLGLGAQISKTVHYETELDLWMGRQDESLKTKLFAESRLHIAYMPVPDFLKIYAGGGVDMVFETDGLVPLPVLEAGVSVKPFAPLPRKEAMPPKEPRPQRERRQREPMERHLKERTVTFVSNGGTNAPVQTVFDGGQAALPEGIFRENYTLEGWYRDRRAVKNKWNFDADMVTRNITLYAKWNINQYTVTFETDGGDPVPGSPMIIDHGETVIKPSVIFKSQYLFGDWYTDSDLTVPAVFPIAITGNTTLYAQWLQAYTVAFEADGGAPAPSSPITRYHGETVIQPPAMSKPLYLFDDWYTDSEMTVPAVFPIAITEDITLYAKWELEPLPLRYAVYFKGERGREADLDVTSEIDDHETSDEIEDDDISLRLLQRAGQRLAAEPNTHIWLNGYAAPVGTKDGQIATSAARVRYCVEYLMRHYGIPENRMHQDFHGAQPPDMQRVFPHLSSPPRADREEYYQYWRRVELIVDVFN